MSYISASTSDLLLLALIALTLSGCARSGPEGDLDEYVQKLERVLEQGVHPLSGREVPKLPDGRELRREFDSGAIDIVEFLQIDRCELQQLVAERNSSLGKLAGPSQRLVYEVNFLGAGVACLDAIGEDYPELADALAEVLASKRERLPALIWQGTLGGEEFRRFWRFGNQSLPQRFDSDGSLLLALGNLTSDVERWLAGDYRIESARLESQLETIGRGNGGVQIRAWMLLANKLDVASTIMRDRLARRPLCFEGMHPPAANIFDRVVRDVFIGKIQPWAARLNSRYYEVFPPVRRLEMLLADGEPGAYSVWRQTRDRQLAYATAALARHAEALGPLFDQCELGPAGMREANGE